MGMNEGNQISKGREECWMKITYLKIFCEECPPGFYTLQRALTTGLSNIKETKCLKCPYGASCANGTIKAKENFWGLEDTCHDKNIPGTSEDFQRFSEDF